MVEVLEQRTSTTQRANRRTAARHSAVPEPAPTTSPTPVRPGDVAPVATPTGLRAEEARWLPLAVPGFAVLLVVCTALILGMAAAGT